MRFILLLLAALPAFCQLSDTAPRKYYSKTYPPPTASAWTGKTVQIIDGTCTASSAGAVTWCRSDGATWVPVGGSAIDVTAGETGAVIVTPITGGFKVDVDPLRVPNAQGLNPWTIASGSQALGTALIASGACATTITISAPGVLATDVVTVSPNGDWSGVTGYGVGASNALRIYPYTTADNILIKVCNPTGGDVTPGAATLNYRVGR